MNLDQWAKKSSALKGKGNSYMNTENKINLETKTSQNRYW